MRHLQITCDSCGITQDEKRRRDQDWLNEQHDRQQKPRLTIETGPLFWWSLEETGAGGRHGPVDLCSLGCASLWVANKTVRQAYAEDWVICPVHEARDRLAASRRRDEPDHEKERI